MTTESTDTGKASKKPRAKRTSPWRDDFQGLLDRFGAARGGPVRYDPKAKALEGWDATGWHAIGEGIDGKAAAYWYVRGRLDEAGRNSD